MSSNTELLAPLVVLVGWSLVMWLWMYATRIPAIQAANLKLDPSVPAGELLSKLPAKVRWKADNYNHLMEQPTIFYALVLALTLLEQATEINIYLAWTYVILRICHSLLQALVNKIEIRFSIFAMSNIPLFALTFNALRIVF